MATQGKRKQDGPRDERGGQGQPPDDEHRDDRLTAGEDDDADLEDEDDEDLEDDEDADDEEE